MSRAYNVWTISYTDLAGAMLAGTVRGYFVSDQTAAEALRPAHERSEAIAHFPVTSRYTKAEQYQRAVMFCNFINRGIEHQQAEASDADNSYVDILSRPHTAEETAASALETMRVLRRLKSNSAAEMPQKKRASFKDWVKSCMPGRRK